MTMAYARRRAGLLQRQVAEVLGVSLGTVAMWDTGRKMLFVEPEKYFTNAGTRKVADRYRRFYIKSHDFMRPRDFKQMYEAMNAGDPKLRTLRALYVTVYSAYAKYAGESAARREVNTDV